MWLAVARDQQLVRLDTRTGRPIGSPIKMPYSPGAVAVTKDAVWAALVPAGPAGPARQDRPEDGEDARHGLLSVRDHVADDEPDRASGSPPAAARVIQRVDPKTGGPVKTIRVGQSRSEDIVYHKGALWLATADDDTVYKVMTASGDSIPISVGSHPRQLAVTDDTVYVTNYNSSNLTEIDASSSRVVGSPLELAVNPFSLAVDGKALWVASQPDNVLTKVLTGRDE